MKACATPGADQAVSSLKRISELLERRDVVILDTETTGHRAAEVIELSVIDTRGEVLFDRLIRPRQMLMNRYAYKVHGISLDMLTAEPTLPEVLPELEPILENSVVLAWNAPFDHLMIQRSRQIWDLEPRQFRHECAMLLYAALHGRRSFGLHRAIKAMGLEHVLAEHESHRALGDVNLLLELLRSVVASGSESVLSPTLP